MLNKLFANPKTMTVLKVAGTLLALSAMVLGGVADDPTMWPR